MPQLLMYAPLVIIVMMGIISLQIGLAHKVEDKELTNVSKGLGLAAFYGSISVVLIFIKQLGY